MQESISAPYKGMRLLFLRLAVLTVLPLYFVCCGDFLRSGYTAEFPAELPQPPEAWVSLLGKPHWRLEWLDPAGYKQIADVLPGESLKIELPTTWANPVTAFPYWPEKNVPAGLFKPAGAIFPFDAAGGAIRLSWEGGPASVFYWEIALAGGENASKIPANFDWPRFRELFTAGTLNETVAADPWLVNWRYVAERTIASNFDRRRLVPEAAQLTAIPVPAGVWYGSSPFAAPLFFAEDTVPIFPTRANVDVWVSAAGVLRCNNKAWIFTAWEE